MTHALSFALQEAIYEALSDDPGVSALVGSNVFDAPPSGQIPELYILIGDEVVKGNASKTSSGAIHDMDIVVVSDAAGFSQAKQVSAAVCDALIGEALPLSRGKLVALNFRAARALREDSPGVRQINLKFRAFVEDD